MRVLFDQATPVPIRTCLIGHTVRTAAQEHWDTLQNGDLLTVAEHAGFEVFLTTDKNMRHQQNWPAGALRSSSLAFSSGQPLRGADISSLVAQVEEAVGSAGSPDRRLPRVNANVQPYDILEGVAR